MILAAIADLHENALVAWDRDGVDMPELQPSIDMARVVQWSGNADATWRGASLDDVRTGGIGAVAIWAYGVLKWRAVLHVADNPLGVAWWIESCS